MSCEFYLPISILVVEIVLCKYYHCSWTNKEFQRKNIFYVDHKYNVVLFIWICFTLLWIYKENKIRNSTIYLKVFSSSAITCRASNTTFHHIFEYIFIWHDYMEWIKDCVPPFIWMYFPLTWLYVENKKDVSPCIWMYYPLLFLYADHQGGCGPVYLNALYSDVSICRASNKVLHYFKW